MKPEDIEKLKVYVTLTNTLDKYVYLREDKKGKYIEYAFMEGAPHDNRCLSWYDSYQEKAYIRNGWVKNPNDEKDREYLNIIKKNRDEKVNKLFRLSSYTCGYEEHPDSSLEGAKESWAQYHPDEPFIPEDHICKVGCPAPKCRDTYCKYWTYEEPVKCACWILSEINIPEEVYIPIDIAVKLFDKITEELNHDTRR